MGVQTNEGHKDGRHRTSHAETFESFRRLIEKVSRMYVECKRAQPLGAWSYDPFKPRRGRTVGTIHFTVDCEHAVESMAKELPEKVAYVRLFVRAAAPDGLTRIEPGERRMVWRLGSELRRRRLDNLGAYFAPVRCYDRSGSEERQVEQASMQVAVGMADLNLGGIE